MEAIIDACAQCGDDIDLNQEPAICPICLMTVHSECYKEHLNDESERDRIEY